MASRILAAAILLAVTTGCGHWRDQAMIDAGRAFVPPEIPVIGDSDNEGAIGLLSGDYQAFVYFADAELGPEELVDAFAVTRLNARPFEDLTEVALDRL